MYQVIKMCGYWEPWWFPEDWEEDIIEERVFDSFDEALSFYSAQWHCMKEQFPSFKSHENLLATFWNVEEQYWCDDCNDYLQQYHSILLLENKRELPKNNQGFPDFEIQNDMPKTPSGCRLKL